MCELVRTGNGGVVDQNVELAPFRHDGAYRVGDLTLVGDVNIAVDDVVVLAPKLLGKRFALVLKHVEDRDLRALFDETLDGRAADSTGTSGDDRNLVSQALHRASSLFLTSSEQDHPSAAPRTRDFDRNENLRLVGPAAKKTPCVERRAQVGG